MAMRSGQRGLLLFFGVVGTWGCNSEDPGGGGVGGQPAAALGGSSTSLGGQTATPPSGGQTANPGNGGQTANPGNGGATGIPTTDGQTYGVAHSGQYHLGPVDFAETEWHNACAPTGGYVSSLRDSTGLSGEYLAGLSNAVADAGGTCDACILVSTATGKQIVARVVTYGDTNEPGDIDVSPSVYAKLNTNEYPRSMTWKFARCPDAGMLRYEFQTGSNIWWTSLWVRNPRVPLTKVEVKSSNHSSYVSMERGTDGTLTDASGFGDGAFTLRLTAMDGQVIEDSFPSFTPGAVVVSTKQFQ